jgi:hypothetical protein
MSSPNINHIINVSCIFLYMSPILNSIKGLLIPSDTATAGLMCQLNAWIIPTCSTIVYASMLMKAWRIFKIFETTNKIKKVIIKDVHLVCYILCIVLFDLGILVFWQAADPIHIRPRHILEAQFEPTKISMSNRLNLVAQSLSINDTTGFFPRDNTSGALQQQVIVQNVAYKNEIKILYECNSNFNEVWISLFTIYKIVMLMYGIYLAWLIRNINVPSMNDSKYLILSTYVIVVCGLGSMSLMQVGVLLFEMKLSRFFKY